ncbi:mannitol operon transcriptional antiterminator [Lactobacillus colini]|uniref:Mannitol operon transcriptional antiterminator n=1 Tax=Lactobacillus colini TaxID=1819254 RepID=A0ABS4MFB1_9LACO|nr:HTH domain-containing protein [Lactobacillus colini]MBP2058375.1 mannitol operon transcriptional antiterminator [Lactobacillus colini]
MILTERQKAILSLFLTSQEITVAEIEQRINISRRTVYREFNDLRNILKEQNVNLISKKNKYSLIGDKQDLADLQSLIQQTPSQTMMSVQAREKAIAVLLLLSDEPQKIIRFALDLKVSEATIQNDLDVVSKLLANYGVKLVRMPGIGVNIQIDEYRRRQILIGILLSEINDYEFFHYLNHQDSKNNNFFLELFSKKELIQVRNWLESTIFDVIHLNSDHQIIDLILSFVVTLKRIASGHLIKDFKQAAGSLKYEGLVFKFMALAADTKKLQIEQADVNYLAEKVMICDGKQVNMHYDNDNDLIISIKVKRLVKEVSEKVHWNFQKNPYFIKRLSTHIIGLLRRSVTSLPDARIETLTSLSQRFSKLYRAISEAWPKIFLDEKINKSELQLLLLYFANEYTNSRNNHDLNALVICENGIGTSAILRTRLRQELPEIKQIKISKVADLSRLNLQDYDLILSTLELKGFSRKYQLVSPLLLSDEISKIKNYLKDYERKFSLKPTHQTDHLRQDAVKKLAEISIQALTSSELVNDIRVQRLTNNSLDLISVVQECVANTENVIRNQTEVTKKILQRIQLAPVGIPNSQLALLHTSDKEIKKCSFVIFDLDNQLSMKAMDHTEISVKRILLMLGPEKLSETEQSIMSMISSMIIMNDTNFKLFTNASQNQIKNAIADQFLQQIKRKFK